MLEDFRDAPDDLVIDTDLCIIGGGAAGITIARELAGRSLDICLLESGGLRFEGAIQDLYVGEIVGLACLPLDASRLRYLGGSTNHWAGRCAPFPASDFRHRPWVPYSGWPITRADLDPFYERAQPICGLGPYEYRADVLWPRFGLDVPDFDPALLETQLLQVSAPVRFGEAYREDLVRAGNVRVILHANVTNIQSSPNGAGITHVDIANLAGKRGKVRAKVFILCCGAVENARLLLSSDTVEPHGVGNRHDLVGRFYMDHPIARCAELELVDPYAFVDRYRSLVEYDGTTFEAGLRLGEGVTEREKTLNALGMAWTVDDPDSGVAAARSIARDLEGGEFPDEFRTKIGRVIRDFGDVAWNTYRVLVQDRSAIVPPRLIYFEAMPEQAPNPDSRVTLADEQDALGMRRVALAWRLTELDRHTIETLARTVAREFGRLDIGRLRLDPWLWGGADDPWGENVRGNVHPSGTTRMADDPRHGVVDRNCKVHGVGNLFVMGGSVFPTTGTVNPTLTIVALALRLADRLRDEFA